MKKLLHVNSKEQTVTSSPHPPIPDFFMVKLNDIFQVMCEIIEEGVKTGEFRKVDVVDASSILGAMIRGFYFRGPIRFKEYSIEESTDPADPVCSKNFFSTRKDDSDPRREYSFGSFPESLSFGGWGKSGNSQGSSEGGCIQLLPFSECSRASYS